MTGPAVEAEALPCKARGDVGGHHGGLDQQGAGAAQRIHQRCPLARQRRPARAHQQRRGEVLLERGVADVAPVAATVQALPGEVDAQDEASAVQVGVEAQVGGLDVHRRARLPAGLQPLYHAVLDRLGAEAGMADLVAATMEVHRQGAALGQVLFPGQGCGGEAQRLGGGDALLPGETEDHPVGQA